MAKIIASTREVRETEITCLILKAGIMSENQHNTNSRKGSNFPTEGPSV